MRISNAPLSLLSLASFASLFVSIGACGGRLAADSDGGTGTNPDGGDHPLPSFDGGPTPTFDGGPIPPKDGGPQPPPPVQHSGYVVIESVTNPQPASYASASFFDTVDPGCTFLAPTSGCALATCDNNATIGQESAGPIAISGGSQPITLLPNGNAQMGVYTPFNSQNQVFTQGQSITIAAQGALVPAFKGAFTFPGPIKVFSPTITQNQPTVIDTTKDLVVAWSSSSADAKETLFYLQTDEGNGKLATLSCFFDATVQKAIVPQSMLTSFKMMSGAGRSSYVLVFPATRALTVVGGWGVTLFGVGPGPVGPATIQ